MFRNPFKPSQFQDAEFSKTWFENAAFFREVVFTTIESAIILAALEVAATRTNHFVFWLLYALSFCALVVYLQVLVRHLINATNDRFELISNPRLFPVVAVSASTLFSASSVFIVTGMTSAFIEANFMQ